MHILYLNPYHTGSHAAFASGWAAHAAHRITIFDLPGHHWKWRMRHAALTLARRASDDLRSVHDIDAVVATDMMALTEWRGLVPPRIAALPHVLYCHENQLAYPDPTRADRDHHFGFTNLLSMHAADAIWWNSAYHRDACLDAGRDLLRKMPDHRDAIDFDAILDKSSIEYPGITPITATPTRPPGPLRIAWVSRWEHDKRPELFFAAIDHLANTGVVFQLIVLGESFRNIPDCFADARTTHADRIHTWGYQTHHADYAAALRSADVVVSTAAHEYFGIAIVEAMSAGCIPLVPDALAYPEVIDRNDAPPDWFHNDDPTDIAARLAECAKILHTPTFHQQTDLAISIAHRYAWPYRAAAMDEALERLRDSE